MEARPADFPIPRLPMGTFSDVPVHRGVVGAAHITMGSQEPDNFYENFKPYVYRGTGVDTLTPELGEDWSRAEYEAAPKPKRYRKRKAKPKPKPRKYHWDDPRHARHWDNSTAPVPPEPRYRIGDRRHPEHHIYYKSHPQPLGPEPEPELELELEPEPLPARPIRPAPGWQPMTGADIDALLEELDAEQS